MLQFLEILGLALLPAFLLLDLFAPARSYLSPGGWKLRGAVVSVLTLATAVAVSLFWAAVVGDRSVFDLDGLGMLGGAAVGVLVYNVLLYAYHRLIHESDFLFTRLHQMHHSAESIDAFGAFYLHPVDNFMFTTWSSLVFFPLLGVTPAAGALGAAFITFNSVFQHMNKATPHWVGYLIQRPESHALHHERGVHRHNYCDLPVIDMLMGTFVNPRSVEGREAGFYTGASSRIGEMLMGRDVTQPPGRSNPAREPRLERSAA